MLVEGVTGDDAKSKEIKDFVKQNIAPYKYPRDIRFVSELPRNPSGKLQHFKLRQRLKEEAQVSEASQPEVAELKTKGS